ncbi:MAG: DUF3333 domain-containing protein, partial [Pseudomonadota bacterium]
MSVESNVQTSAERKAASKDFNLKKRYAAERRFQVYGIIAIALGVFFLGALLFSVATKGYTAFWQTSINLDVTFDEKVIDPSGKRATDPNVLLTANYSRLARNALAEKLGLENPNRPMLRDVNNMISAGARIQLRS